MHSINFHFLSRYIGTKNYLYSKPVKGLRGCGVGYSFSFNGKENDDETQTQDYGFRIYNNRLGRFLSVDPLTQSYPWNSTYAFAENDMIRCIDLDGLEKLKAIDGVTTVDGPLDMNRINSSKVVQANIIKQRAMNMPPPMPKFNPENSTSVGTPTKTEPLPLSLGLLDDKIRSSGPDAAGGSFGVEGSALGMVGGVSESRIESENGTTNYTTVKLGGGTNFNSKSFLSSFNASVSYGPSIDLYYKTDEGEGTPASELLLGKSNYFSIGLGINVTYSWTENDKGKTTMRGFNIGVGAGCSKGEQFTFETIGKPKEEESAPSK